MGVQYIFNAVLVLNDPRPTKYTILETCTQSDEPRTYQTVRSELWDENKRTCIGRQIALIATTRAAKTRYSVIKI